MKYIARRAVEKIVYLEYNIGFESFDLVCGDPATVVSNERVFPSPSLQQALNIFEQEKTFETLVRTHILNLTIILNKNDPRHTLNST
jgi:hypothetical protein